MAKILIIETATRICSVAVAIDGKVAALRESGEKNIHASMTAPFVEQVLNQTGISTDELDAVSVSRGPGSYTGLRIGVSTAKGICYAKDIPLISVSTLQAMAYGAAKETSGENFSLPVIYRPMIDARRMEVYTASFDLENNMLKDTEAKVLDKDSLIDELENNVVWFFGDGAEKCRSLLGDHPNSRFIEHFTPSAKHMGYLSEKKFGRGDIENLAYFEPFYLKDFIAGIPRVKGLDG